MILVYIPKTLLLRYVDMKVLTILQKKLNASMPILNYPSEIQQHLLLVPIFTYSTKLSTETKPNKDLSNKNTLIT